MLDRREVECSSLKKRLDDSTAQVEAINHARSNTIRESRMLQEDLATLSNENKRLAEDVDALLDERSQLANQVQEYVAEVRRVEEVLAQKVSHLITTWRSKARVTLV